MNQHQKNYRPLLGNLPIYDWRKLYGRTLNNPVISLQTLDELLERDNQREEDGFERKIKLGKIVKPSENGSNEIVIVPTTIETKFYHDNQLPMRMKWLGNRNRGRRNHFRGTKKSTRWRGRRWNGAWKWRRKRP